MIGTGVKVTGRAVFYYVAFVFYVARFVWDVLTKLGHTIVQAVRG